MVGVANRLTHLIQGQTMLIKRIRIEVNAHRRQRATADTDIANAFGLGNFLRQHG